MNIPIQTLNNDLSLSGIVTGYSLLTFTRALNSQGSFRVEINYNNANAQYLAQDKLILIDKTLTIGQGTTQKSVFYYFVGYIDKVTISQSGNKSNEMLIAEGVELKDRLDRVIFPASGYATDSYTNEYLETVVKSLIQKNASGTDILGITTVAASARQIPYLEVVTDSNQGTQIDYSARYKDLSTEIYSLLASQEMGLSADINLTSNKILFDVYEGIDRTATEGLAGGIVLSLDTKTALSIVDTDDKLTYRNLSITAGLGEGTSRTIEEVSIGTPTGYARRETFTDARDIESDDELTNRGSQKLALTTLSKAIQVKHNDLGSYQVGTHFDLGDFISVQTVNGLYDAQVLKVTSTFNRSDIPVNDLVLAFDINDNIEKAISSKHQSYDAVVGKDSSAGGGGSTYDGLTDTPSSKTGNALKLVRVNSGETAHEYIAPGGIDGTAIHDNVANEITAITEKTTPADDDIFIIEDSAASYVKKKIKYSNFKIINKNLLINGNFEINQEGSASYTSAGYTLDQWEKASAGTVSQDTIDETDSKYALKITGDGSGVYMWQYIENLNNVLYNKECTLSFWAKGSVALSNVYVLLRNYTLSTSIEAQTYNITTDWTKFTFTFSASTNWNNGDVIEIRPLAPAAIANAEYVLIKQAKLEIGSVATDFVPRTYAEELALCQRYYCRSSAYDGFGYRYLSATIAAKAALIKFPVPMRVSPTVTYKTALSYYRCSYYDELVNQEECIIRVTTTATQSYRAFGGDIEFDARI